MRAVAGGEEEGGGEREGGWTWTERAVIEKMGPMFVFFQRDNGWPVCANQVKK